VLIQYGIMLITTVLLDTFIVRIFLVPALCTLLARFNWFPGIRAPITKDMDDMSDEIEDEQRSSGAGAQSAALTHWEDWMGFSPSSSLRRTTRELLSPGSRS
jgi:hypothetical protein